MEKKVKILLKEERKDAHKAMQLESKQLFLNAGYMLDQDNIQETSNRWTK